MTVKMLVFDYRETEHKYFKNNNFENFDIKFFDFSLNEETVKKLENDDLEHTYVISVFINSLLTQNVLDKFKNLRIVATRSTGHDNINTKACMNRNISVVNVQKYGETAVAEFTMGLIISLVRKLPQGFLSVREGNFEGKSFVGRDLKALTLGIVGTGAIGASVCKLANAFGMKILAYDLTPRVELTEKYGVKYTTLEAMIMNSDIITLHLPYTGDNYHMFSKHQFDLMKKNSYFINVSRGELVDNLHLKENLENGKLLGVALDVVACESPCDACIKMAKNLEISSLECLRESEIIKELISMPNVIITPHMAYESQDAIDYILDTTFDSIKDCINGGNKNRII
ncbi:MAG: hypothetical protein E7Z93_04385 [Cyanobacteria bacterium SIG32]|nr:hypothetical protein [Cyanobacteria bacterium SIG32]